jgi:GTPase SAR1 family protein
MKSSKRFQVKDHLFSYWLQHGSSTIQKFAVSGMGPRRSKFDQVIKYLIRQYWEMYYPNTNAILYVVDSNDKQRFSKAS